MASDAMLCVVALIMLPATLVITSALVEHIFAHAATATHLN